MLLLIEMFFKYFVIWKIFLYYYIDTYVCTWYFKKCRYTKCFWKNVQWNVYFVTSCNVLIFKYFDWHIIIWGSMIFVCDIILFYYHTIGNDSAFTNVFVSLPTNTFKMIVMFFASGINHNRPENIVSVRLYKSVTDLHKRFK